MTTAARHNRPVQSPWSRLRPRPRLGWAGPYGLVRYWWVLADEPPPPDLTTLVFPPLVSSTVIIVVMAVSVFRLWGRTGVRVDRRRTA